MHSHAREISSIGWHTWGFLSLLIRSCPFLNSWGAVPVATTTQDERQSLHVWHGRQCQLQLKLQYSKTVNYMEKCNFLRATFRGWHCRDSIILESRLKDTSNQSTVCLPTIQISHLSSVVLRTPLSKLIVGYP